MINIIIPVYNNKQALYPTLFSIGTTNTDICITIVDDGSDDTDYNDIITFFSSFFPINVIYSKENNGPGIARNMGIDNSLADYIVFIDCGDVFTSPFTIKHFQAAIKDFPLAGMISFPHLEEYDNGNIDITDATNNRLHGKIFKRSFLNQYQIRFNPECPRINEDIGFCQIIRYLGDSLKETLNIDTVINLQDAEAAVIWCHDPNSIVRRHNFQYGFARQNIGLAFNALYSIKMARKWGVSETFIQPILCQQMAFMYVMYMYTKNGRPEYLEPAWEGAQYFYNNIYLDYQNCDTNMIIRETQMTIADAYNDLDSPFNSAILDYTYLQFLTDLEKRRVEGVLNEQLLLDYITSNG